MLHLKSDPGIAHEKALYAAPEDFEQIFAKESTKLFQFALDLTADAETAESCLALAMRDCVLRSGVQKDRAYAWARRMVMRNAIRLVWGTPNDILGQPGFECYLQPSDFAREGLRESVAILALPDFDRLAFVICVLERFSILDCAFLLGKAPQEVYDAIVRATCQVVPIEERKRHEEPATFPGDMYGALWGQVNSLEGSCGSILD